MCNPRPPLTSKVAARIMFWIRVRMCCQQSLPAPASTVTPLTPDKGILACSVLTPMPIPSHHPCLTSPVEFMGHSEISHRLLPPNWGCFDEQNIFSRGTFSWSRWFVMDTNSLKHQHSPDRCVSVDWVSSYKVKGPRLDSQSGHMLGLWVRSPVGVCARGSRLMFLFHMDVSLFLPPFPSL